MSIFPDQTAIHMADMAYKRGKADGRAEVEPYAGLTRDALKRLADAVDDIATDDNLMRPAQRVAQLRGVATDARAALAKTTSPEIGQRIPEGAGHADNPEGMGGTPAGGSAKPPWEGDAERHARIRENMIAAEAWPAGTTRDEKRLRGLLARRVGLTYGDDGELQSSDPFPPIDFKRDTVEDIERKMVERGMAKLAQEQASPVLAVGLLPGPELGPHDKLPCAVACEGGPTFHQGVQLRALLGYLARRVTYNNQPPPTPEAKAQFKALLNEARGNSVVAVGQDDGVSAIPPGPIRDLGARLASMLDEDRWASIEPYLLACLSQVRVEEPKT